MPTTAITPAGVREIAPVSVVGNPNDVTGGGQSIFISLLGRLWANGLPRSDPNSDGAPWVDLSAGGVIKISLSGPSGTFTADSTAWTADSLSVTADMTHY